ncbi:glycosyltransferase family 4 protein [Dermabacteraceae bacterium P13264]
MRVGFVLGPSTGGIGVHVASLQQELSALCVESLVVTSELSARSHSLSNVKIAWPGGPHQLYRMGAALTECDLVHAHGLRAGFWASLVSGRKPLVVSLHNQAPADSRAGKLTARRSALMTGASGDLVELARGWGAKNTALAEVPSPRTAALLAAPRAKRPEKKREVLRELGLDPQRPVLLSVARDAPQKRLFDLAQLARLSEAQVVLVGDAKLPGVTSCPGDRLDELYFAADVFVLLSAWEARALVVQEAMAAGLPVVATDSGGLSDLVREAQTGFLVPVGQPQAAARAVQRLLTDPSLAAVLGEAGREIATSWCDPAGIAQDWCHTYADLVGARTAR